MKKESSSQEATLLVLFFVYTFYLLEEIYSPKTNPLLRPPSLLSAYQLFDEASSIIVKVEA